MSVLDLMRQGYRNEPNVEEFLKKYELWEALVLNLGFQIDQTKALLSEQMEAPESPKLRTRLAEDERTYDEESRELRQLAVKAILHPLRKEAPALAATLGKAMRVVGVDPAGWPADALGPTYADLERLSAAVTLWQASRS